MPKVYTFLFETLIFSYFSLLIHFFTEFSLLGVEIQFSHFLENDAIEIQNDAIELYWAR